MAYSYKLPECYIYLYHTDEYFILPQYPESIQDALGSTFQSTNALARTAPVFSYSNSGPRTMTISLNLHRDMMNDANVKGSNIRLDLGGVIRTGITDENKDDYVDVLIKKLQSIALPKYKASNKEVDPPRVAIRLGNEIFIKGIVNGGVRVDYSMPLLVNKKYAQVQISFTVSETTPFDAESVGRDGSFRGLTSGLRTKMGFKD